MNPNSSFDKTSAQSELEWRAWCYLNGELSAHETQAFEAQLHEPAVCRLLAELIEVQASLQTTPAAPAPTPVLVSRPQPVSTAAQGHRWSGIIVLLTTTAALWLVFFGSWTSDSDNTLAQHRTESQQLTALWLTPDADNPDADNMAATGDDFLSDTIPGFR
ncbi:MAG: hypothetical protein U0903_12345 [Planctomycetales bacterium]